MDFNREIDILSGQAELRLQSERAQLLVQHSRQAEDREARRRLLSKMDSAPATDGLLPSVAAMSAHEKRNYSLQRAVRALTAPGKREHCLETELSQAIADDIGAAPHCGVYVPLKFSMSGLDTKTNAAGKYTVGTKLANIADALRPAATVLRLGAEFISGIRGDFAVPVESNVMTASWVAENPGSDAAQSDSSFGQRVLTPHAMCAVTSVSRQLLTQSSESVDQWLFRRIAKAHAQLLDQAAICGSGLNNQPLGIMNVPNIPTVAIGQNGGALAASHLISLESTVGDANGDTGSLGFLTNSPQRGKLRSIPEIDNGTTPLWDDNSLLDYPAFASNLVPSNLSKGTSSGNCSAVLFGNWNAVLIAEFLGAIELVFDPYTQKKKAMVEISSYDFYDLALMNLGSMAVIVDAI